MLEWLTSERRNIAKGCFIGGAVFTLLAILINPRIWYLAAPAGFMAGYMAYNFRSVLRAVPEAASAAWHAAAEMMVGLAGEANEFFGKPHHFLYSSIFISSLAAVLSAVLSWDFIISLISTKGIMAFSYPASYILYWLVMGLIVVVTVFFFVSVLVHILVFSFAFAGCRVAEKSYWYPFLDRMTLDRRRGKLQAEGLREVPITYLNLARWFLKGLGLFILLFIWHAPKRVMLFFVSLFVFLFRFEFTFLVYLFDLIHCRQRVVCGIDGTLGGIAAYFLMVQPGMHWWQAVFAVVVGGFIGAGIGLLNWELVSVRWREVAGTVPRLGTQALKFRWVRN
jgi:hypothetical protein